MKVYIYVLIFLLQQMHLNADFTWLSNLKLGLECITVSQLYNATKTLCAQKDNADLWQKVINCHNPITPNFLRTSGKSRCFYPDYGVDPTDSSHTLQKVFLNICGILEAPWKSLPGIGVCLVAGWNDPSIDSHSKEKTTVKSNWGDNILCNIGKCVLGLGLGT